MESNFMSLHQSIPHCLRIKHSVHACNYTPAITGFQKRAGNSIGGFRSELGSAALPTSWQTVKWQRAENRPNDCYRCTACGWDGAATIVQRLLDLHWHAWFANACTLFWLFLFKCNWTFVRTFPGKKRGESIMEGPMARWLHKEYDEKF